MTDKGAKAAQDLRQAFDMPPINLAESKPKRRFKLFNRKQREPMSLATKIKEAKATPVFTEEVSPKQSVTVNFPNDTAMTLTGDRQVIRQLIGRLDGLEIKYTATSKFDQGEI